MPRSTRADERNAKLCEFAITVAEDWRRAALGSKLLASLVRRARYDGYESMEGWVLAQNVPMLALARKLDFRTETTPGDATMLRVHRALQPPASRRPTARVRD